MGNEGARLKRIEHDTARPIAIARYCTNRRLRTFSFRVITSSGTPTAETVDIVRRLVAAGRL